MFEKLKNIFNEKDEKKKSENLIVFLIILVVTLIIINKIWNDDSNNNEEIYKKQSGTELVTSSNEDKDAVLVSNGNEDNLEKNLEDILSKINGVGKVDVLITYQKDNPLKIEGAIVAAEGVR